ncbi:MAG TPA: hypothetical protein VFP09_11375 [Desertimonas sp.]|nr:hypothetical protein [Desertimonas sp.]
MTYLAMTRGDDRVLDVTATEDLTGANLYFTVRHRRYTPDPPLITKATDGDGIELGTPTTAEITIDAADTVGLDPDVGYWDLVVIDSADKTYTIASGRFAIVEDVDHHTA